MHSLLQTQQHVWLQQLLVEAGVVQGQLAPLLEGLPLDAQAMALHLLCDELERREALSFASAAAAQVSSPAMAYVVALTKGLLLPKEAWSLYIVHLCHPKRSRAWTRSELDCLNTGSDSSLCDAAVACIRWEGPPLGQTVKLV